MKAQVRLNHDGKPYLMITFSHDKLLDPTVEDDAESLFIKALSISNGQIYTSHLIGAGNGDLNSTTVSIHPNPLPKIEAAPKKIARKGKSRGKSL